MGKVIDRLLAANRANVHKNNAPYWPHKPVSHSENVRSFTKVIPKTCKISRFTNELLTFAFFHFIL
jgi:hypothetical protein